MAEKVILNGKTMTRKVANQRATHRGVFGQITIRGQVINLKFDTERQVWVQA